MPARGLHVVITGDPKGFQRALAQAGVATDAFAAKQKGAAAKAQSAGSTMTKGVTLPLLALGGAAVTAATKFEQQMSSVAAVTRAPRDAMEKLRAQALKAGADTAFSAREAAIAQTELAKGGIDTANILGGALPAALSLAAAGQLDLGEAAEVTANAMNLFGLRGGDAGKVADALATAANETTADVSDFGMAMKQAGSVARLAGYDFTETMVGLEALAAAGIKNSDAGTSMKAAMMALLGPTRKQAELASDLGLSFVGADGKMRDLADISGQLRDRLGRMGEAQRAATLKTLAGADGVRFLASLYQAGPAQMEKYEQGLAKQGTAAETARKKQDNLAGKVEQLGGSLETLGIVIGSAVLPPLAALAVGATGVANDVARAFSSLSPAGQQAVLASVAVVAALGPILYIGGRVAAAVAALRSGVALLGMAVTPVRLALLAAGVAMAVFGGHTGAVGNELAGIGSAFGSLGTVLMMLGAAVGGVLTPIGGLVGAFAKSEVGARLLQGAITGLIAAGLATLGARLAAMVAPAFAFMRALFSVAGATTAVAIGMQRLRVAFASNPIGILLTVVGVAAGALGAFNTKQRETKLAADQVADAVLQARNAIDRYKDASLENKNAQLQLKEAELNVKNAVAERRRVYKDATATSRQKEGADLAVARANLELERAERGAARSSRDKGAQQRKATADAQAQLEQLRKNIRGLETERDALKRLEARMRDYGASSSQLRAVRDRQAKNAKDLQTAEGQLRSETKRVGDATDQAGTNTLKGLGKILGGIPFIDKLKSSMRGVSRVRVSLGGFAGSILSGLSSLFQGVASWVGRIRDKMKEASAAKRKSPSPNDVIAAGFVDMGRVVVGGYADVHGKAVAGADRLRAAFKAAPADWQVPAPADTPSRLFDIDQQIRDLQAFGEATQALNAANDRTEEIAAARRATKSKRRSGEEKRDYRERIKDAKAALTTLIRDEERAQAQARIDFQITGLERIRAFNDAIRDIGDSMRDSVNEIVETRIADRLKGDLAQIEASARGALAGLDENTGGDARAVELRAIRGRQRVSQEAREDADALNKVNEARLTEARYLDRVRKAQEGVAAAQAAADRAARTGSQRLVDMANRRLASAKVQLTLQQQAQANARAGVVAAEADQAAITDDRRAAQLAADLEAARAAAQETADQAREGAERRAEAAKEGHDLEINSFRSMLQRQLDEELAQLQQRKHSYQDFVTDVQAILGPLGGQFVASGEQEAVLMVAEPAPPPVASTGKKKRPRRRRRASGGEVRDKAEIARVGELGPENVILHRGDRVTPASRSGSGPAIGVLNVYPQGRAGEDTQALAAWLGFQIATRAR